MFDRPRLRNLTRELSTSYDDLIRSRSEAEHLIELAGLRGSAGVFESIQSLNKVARWCDEQVGDINRRMRLADQDPFPYVYPSNVAVANANAYDGRQIGRLLNRWFDEEHLPTAKEWRKIIRELALNDRDLEYVGALFQELGGERAAQLAPMILASHITAADPDADPAHPEDVDPKVIERALDDLQPFNEALLFALNHVGRPGGVDDAFLEAFAKTTSEPGAPEGDPNDAETALRLFNESLTMAGFAAPVAQAIAQQAGPKPKVVFDNAGRFIGVVSMLMLAGQLEDGDLGDKAAVAAEIVLTGVALVPGPVGWIATGVLLTMWLFSQCDCDLPPAVDKKRYWVEGEGSKPDTGGLTEYTDKSGAPVPAR